MGSDRPGRPGCWSRSATSPASRTEPTSRPGPAPHRSTHPPGTTSATGSPAPATGRSTGSCTSWPPSSCATPGSAATTTTAREPPGRPRWKRCAASNADSPTSCSGPCSTTPPPTPPARRRAREGTGERLSHPARPAHIPTPTLRISHFPDPPPTSLERSCPPRLDTEGSHVRTLRSVSQEDVVLRALSGDCDATYFVGTRFDIAGRVLQDVPASHLNLVAESERPVVRDVDGQRFLLDDFRPVRPYDDRPVGPQAPADHLDAAPAQRVHPSASALGNQDGDIPRRDDLTLACREKRQPGRHGEVGDDQL